MPTDTPPITDAEIAELGADHHATDAGPGETPYCCGCYYEWPCLTSRLLAERAAMAERITALESVRGFDRVAADAPADEVAVLVLRRVIDSRSAAGDALLDYRNPPRTPRADRLTGLDRALDQKEHERKTWEDQCNDALAKLREREAQLAASERARKEVIEVLYGLTEQHCLRDDGRWDNACLSDQEAAMETLVSLGRLVRVNSRLAKPAPVPPPSEEPGSKSVDTSRG